MQNKMIPEVPFVVWVQQREADPLTRCAVERSASSGWLCRSYTDLRRNTANCESCVVTVNCPQVPPQEPRANGRVASLLMASGHFAKEWHGVSCLVLYN